MPALETLLKPPSKSSDSASLHSAVLLITTKSLEDSLSYAQRCHPTHQGIGHLLDTLTAQSQKQRYETSFYSELKTWSSTSGGGLLAALRNTIGSLILWSTTPANSAEMSPPHYTHRQLVQTLSILGAKTVMRLLIDEAVAHSDSGGPEVETVLDIIVTMISAPQHQNDQPPSTVSLRDALQVEFAQAFEMSKTDLNRATMIVRLHRRVEGILGGQGTIDGGGEDGLIHGVVHNADGVPTADIDDVLVEADHQMTQEFLSGSATFIGV